MQRDQLNIYVKIKYVFLTESIKKKMNEFLDQFNTYHVTNRYGFMP